MITLITGCMGSGKTARLIELAEQVPAERRIVICQTKGELISQPFIESRNGKRIKCDDLNKNQYKLVYIDPESINPKVTHVFIDEVQFPSYGLTWLIRRARINDINLICSGLNRDYRGEPYYRVERLQEEAQQIEHLHAICAITRGYADYSELLTDHESTRKEDYRAVCWDVFKKSKHCRI